LTHRAGERRHARIHAHCEAETKTETRSRQIERSLLDGRAQVVGRHVGNRLGTEDALAVDGAAVEQHLEEARIVHGRTYHAAPARLRGLAHARIVELRVDTDATVIRE